MDKALMKRSNELKVRKLNSIVFSGEKHSPTESSGSTQIITKREREILGLIASGLNSIQIGKKLFISIKAVENHRSHLLKKLGVKNSASLIKKAMELNLIPS